VVGKGGEDDGGGDAKSAKTSLRETPEQARKGCSYRHASAQPDDRCRVNIVREGSKEEDFLLWEDDCMGCVRGVRESSYRHAGAQPHNGRGVDIIREGSGEEEFLLGGAVEHGAGDARGGVAAARAP
jgi:hypothetical protein